MTPADPRFLEGIRLFNAREFFDAHEVWEDLWRDTAGPGRRFVQGLIQAAVCVYHAGNGNARGACRLFESARRYMTAYGTTHWGVEVAEFWAAMGRALGEFLSDPPAAIPRLMTGLLPTITLPAVD